MYYFMWYPIKSIILFSIAPIIGGLFGYSQVVERREKGETQENEGLQRVYKGIGIGLLIDLPMLCYFLIFWSVQ